MNIVNELRKMIEAIEWDEEGQRIDDRGNVYDEEIRVAKAMKTKGYKIAALVKFKGTPERESKFFKNKNEFMKFKNDLRDEGGRIEQVMDINKWIGWLEKESGKNESFGGKGDKVDNHTITYVRELVVRGDPQGAIISIKYPDGEVRDAYLNYGTFEYEFEIKPSQKVIQYLEKKKKDFMPTFQSIRGEGE